MVVYLPQQTDNAAQHGAIAACSGDTPATAVDDIELDVGGTPGTSEDTITLTPSAIARGWHMESISGEPNEATWIPGDYVIRFEVTAENMNVSLREVHVCRVDSSGGSPVTIGSNSVNRALGTAQVETITIAGAEDTGAASDRLYIVLSFSASGHNPASVGLTPSQIVDTPIGGVVAAEPGAFLERFEHMPAPNTSLRM